MNIEMSDKEFRLLLDMVYVGNWVLNSARLEDRFAEYDDLQAKIFACCFKCKMASIAEIHNGVAVPSVLYETGGIHEAIAEYEDTIFFEILAEELARRDMLTESFEKDEVSELRSRMEQYIAEFEQNGVQNVSVDTF